ncbi:MAG: NAD-glutamate dehydrogenase, partial [Pseudomonadota bacterium]|nr:NAD-glutamate dehydrogenase [Pseudomonadota bacterium]
MINEKDWNQIEISEAVMKRVVERLPRHDATLVQAFVKRFYAHVPPAELVTVDDLYGAAVSLWQAGHQREDGQPAIRVYNPQIQDHGWRSRHTVIEIITDDSPFLIDSLTAELNRLEVAVHLAIHPVIKIRRNDAGELVALDSKGHSEAFIHIQIDQHTAPSFLDNIAHRLIAILADVHKAVADWRPMRAALADLARDLKNIASGKKADIDEARAFLGWLDSDHFTYLGAVRLKLIGRGRGAQLEREAGSGLGLLAEENLDVFPELADFGHLPETGHKLMLAHEPLLVTKTYMRSTVHRALPFDAILVRRKSETGAVIGFDLFIGLLTSAAYDKSVRDIPLLRRKVYEVLDRARFSPVSHSGKALLHILESYPRDELYQTDTTTLLNTALG